MENQNQQIQTPPSPNQIHSVNSNSSKSKVVPIIIGIVFVSVAIGAYLLGTKQSQPSVQKVVVQSSPTLTPDPTSAEVVKGEFANNQSMIMKEVRSDEKRKTYQSKNGITTFTVTIPATGYCFGNMLCEYSFDDKHISISFRRFYDITKKDLLGIVHYAYPSNITTSSISFSNFSGLELHNLALGGPGVDDGREIIFLNKEDPYRNVIYLVGFLGWNQNIPQDQYLSILDSIKITQK